MFTHLLFFVTCQQILECPMGMDGINHCSESRDVFYSVRNKHSYHKGYRKGFVCYPGGEDCICRLLAIEKEKEREFYLSLQGKGK